MCKIVAFTNTKRMKLKHVANTIGNILLKIEPDGYGYAVQGNQGIFGEKSVSKTFYSRLNSKHELNLPVVEKKQLVFGKSGQLIGPGIFHGRSSTNEPGLINCHPMQEKGWALIHNGVVTDWGAPYEKTTQNDSEDLLHRFIEGISQVETKLTGYYAFAAIDPDGRLHVVRDDNAELYMAEIPSLDTMIIATTEELLRYTCQQLKLSHGPVDPIKDNVYMIFEGNKLTHHQTINPRGWSRTESQHATTSLGKEIIVRNGDADSRSDGNISRGEYVLGEINKLKESDPLYRFNDGGQFDDDMNEKWYRVEQEFDEMDNSWEIYNSQMEQIQPDEFKRMNYMERELCTVVRYDGLILDWASYTWQVNTA